MDTIQLETTNSTPVMSTSIKPKVSTSTPILSNNRSNKDRKLKKIQSIQPSDNKNTTHANNLPSLNKKTLATALSLRSYNKPSIPIQKLKADVDTILLNKETTKYMNHKLVTTATDIYSQSNTNSSSGSLALSESGSSTTSTFNSNEIICDTSNVVGDTFTSQLCKTDFTKISSCDDEEKQSHTDDLETNVHPCEPVRSSDLNDLSEQPSVQPTASISSQIISSSRSLLRKSMHGNKFVSNNAKEEDKSKKRSVSLLRRSKSQRSVASSTNDVKASNKSTKNINPLPTLNTCKIDPTTFLAGPATPSSLTVQNKQFVLMYRILESMTCGGHVTGNLHIPMDLWYQTNVRLPYIEAKIAASELLIAVLEKMNARKNIELNMSAVINELKVLRQTLNQINDTLMRKLGRPAPTVPLNNKQELGNIHRYSIRTSQTIITWSSRLSKSVEKMRFDTTRNTAPNDEQNELYIKTLMKLFTDAKVLERWDDTLTSIMHKAGKREGLVKEAYQINKTCITQFMTIVCGFVLKDYEILLNKWFKRSIYWLTE
ncbi:hypothetical protein G6F70_004715 [Rhizopus microsporus]|nr:hypothetical protein G6F71_005261 [Rhizopus microsporus]KAG1199662.1 hypothetical protein G6F70_004715 [Rhizopus microsporus]KAG1209105.1 hypothetical protein G6F69_006631 [Rhizopus microsporus]KAG1233324.1 hypothetical protein G6F67_004343 [Rhizopus microsporus]KAG1262716.1 hypothetical protein G6F68_005723 [Rhizopus microsporus]